MSRVMNNGRPVSSIFRHFRCEVHGDIVVTQKDADKVLDAHMFNEDCNPDNIEEMHWEFCPCCGHSMHNIDHCPSCGCEHNQSFCSVEDSMKEIDCTFCESLQDELNSHNPIRFRIIENL